MSKKKKHEEHVDESWLIPYVDKLTLLLALFIALFAISEIDAAKYDHMREVFNVAFGDGEMFDSTTPIPVDLEGEYPNEEMSDNPPIEKEMKDLEELKKEIDAYIEENQLELRLETDLTEKGLMIVIKDHALFDNGEAVIKLEARELAYDISKLLVTNPPRHIEVSGHTDNRPIQTAKYRSNWDLSAMRAINFLKILLENKELDPHNFTALGHGEYQPVATNDTEEGKAKNRRVEVLILPNHSAFDSRIAPH